MKVPQRLACLLAVASLFVTERISAEPMPVTEFNFTGSVVRHTISATGQYRLTAIGADGSAGGFGATAMGIFELTSGSELSILVGGTGNFFGNAGGGGGGSFIVLSEGQAPLVVAGGGGGRGFNEPGGGGRDSAAGTNGGSTDACCGAAGGGGFSGNGQSGVFGGGGGLSYLNGAAGGLNDDGGFGEDAGAGGFGGGGGAYAASDGGGGGGYEGGDGGVGDGGGQGGGSYVDARALDAQLIAGLDSFGGSRDGYVSIALVPEPASLTLLALGAAMGLRRRR